MDYDTSIEDSIRNLSKDEAIRILLITYLNIQRIKKSDRSIIENQLVSKLENLPS